MARIEICTEEVCHCGQTLRKVFYSGLDRYWFYECLFCTCRYKPTLRVIFNPGCLSMSMKEFRKIEAEARKDAEDYLESLCPRCGSETTEDEYWDDEASIEYYPVLYCDNKDCGWWADPRKDSEKED